MINRYSQHGRLWRKLHLGAFACPLYIDCPTRQKDYETLCPQQTFTENALHKSFPNSNAEPVGVRGGSMRDHSMLLADVERFFSSTVVL